MSSKSSSSSAASALSKANKALDEANMKILRELSQIQCNRHCFDCNQRGPNYVDVTIGSFVCMTCSGLLRGLTPPHRVKSISMATFTPDEIELLKSRGNEYCRKVWLATYTARDTSLSTESEPDRRAALKSHMSSKYEQKRYYVDPSKLTPELSEIQSQTLRALSSSQSSISNSNSSSNSSAMQKSPSLSSASSGSSLSLQQNGLQQTQPSPILNNLRNGHANNGPGRIVNSVTLPDIKPLAGLLGSVNLNPINFINNLTNGGDEKIINTNPQKSFGESQDPWGSGGGEFANFANFDEAFTANDGFNNGNFGGDLFAQQNQNSAISNGIGSGSGGGFANFESIQKPLLPVMNGNGNQNNFHQQPQQNHQANGGIMGNGDRYAALKDLDELFKHEPTTNSSGGGGATNGHGHQNGMPNSASVPVNLSTSAGGQSGAPWFQNSPKQNPFSQVGTSPPTGGINGNGNSWAVNGANPSGGANSANPHNPFFNSPSWQITGSSQATQNGSTFGGGQPSQNFQGGSSPFSCGNGFASFQQKVFNPFSAQPTTASNPHNPFL